MHQFAVFTLFLHNSYCIVLCSTLGAVDRMQCCRLFLIELNSFDYDSDNDDIVVGR